MARRMAFRAMEWTVLDRPDDYANWGVPLIAPACTACLTTKDFGFIRPGDGLPRVNPTSEPPMQRTHFIGSAVWASG